MNGSRPGWMQALFAEGYDTESEAEIDRIIDDWVDAMPSTESVEDAFNTVVAQGYAGTEESRDAYTLQAAANGEPLNCAGRAFATAVLAWEQHGVEARPVLQYGGTAADPEDSHVCLLAGRRGGAEGQLYGNKGEANTLAAMDDSEYTYEILNPDGLPGVYMASEAYVAWNYGDKIDAWQPAVRLAGLNLDSPYLNARINEISPYILERSEDGFIFG